MEKNCDMLSRFHPTPGRYGRTDGRRRTDIIAKSKIARQCADAR